MMKWSFPSMLVAVLLLWPGVDPAWAGAEPDAEEEEQAQRQDVVEDIVDHGPFEAVLENYVDEKGMINYEGLKNSNDDRKTLTAYVRSVAGASLLKAGPQARKAFLINAYNALVIDDVIERWPVENVLEEEGFFDEKLHRVAGARMTLDRLEKQALHAQFDDPRTHFAVVCAARSCPRLRTTAFTAENVDEMLESIARDYIPRVTSLGDDGAVTTSQLFEWYEDSFTDDADSVAEFLAEYVDDTELKRALESDEVEIRFSDYDWRINAR